MLPPNHSPSFSIRPAPLLKLAFIVVLGALIGACDADDELNRFKVLPNVEPIEATVRSALPLAYAASAAFMAVEGNELNFVSLSQPCSAFPCSSIVEVDLIHDTPASYFGSSGRLVLAGYWNTPDTAVLIATVVDVDLGTDHFTIRNISTFPVSRTADGISLVYGSIDINIDSEPDDPQRLTEQERQAELDRLNTQRPETYEVALGMDAWVIDVDFGADPTDLADDTYTLSGGGQYIKAGNDSVSVLQAGMVLTTLQPHCLLNPTEGIAVIQEVDVPPGSEANSEDYPVVGQAVMNFHDTCDGKAKIIIANGNYIGTIGRSVTLDLSQSPNP